MRGNLRLKERHCLAPSRLAQIVKRQTGPLPWVHRCSTLQVRQCEVALAVSAVGRTQQREQSRVLGERQELAVTPSPTLRRKVEGEDTDLGNEWVGHAFLLGR